MINTKIANLDHCFYAHIKKAENYRDILIKNRSVLSEERRTNFFVRGRQSKCRAI
ncbi:hypothetical protein HMPREF3213_03007 [Heyndrickxia coagulans]|uniref:Uncharacterized protein n=1 Tax=Heyndrickxia coagulans TaxID=1398 RepID=A0A133KFP3_HEYCO|nr:hypothetical protein HMPREF3213_03007 [Heyndrickxia coagulans]